MTTIDTDDAATLEVRIHPTAVDALGPLARAAAWVSARATHGDPPRVLTTLAGHRRLFRLWLPFAAGLLRGTRLPREDVELVILRTAWNCASWYEWAQHVPLAAEVGLDAQTRARVREGPGAEGWSPRRRALLLATDELHEHRVISDATWRLLTVDLGDQELLELCFVVGHYELLAMTLNSLGVEPEATALARLERADADAAGGLSHQLAARRRGSSASP